MATLHEGREGCAPVAHRLGFVGIGYSPSRESKVGKRAAFGTLAVPLVTRTTCCVLSSWIGARVIGLFSGVIARTNKHWSRGLYPSSTSSTVNVSPSAN